MTSSVHTLALVTRSRKPEVTPLSSSSSISHQNKNHRRRLLNNINGSTWIESAPLFSGLGTHFVTIFVGTPPQRRTVIVDTGSHLTAFPCKGCQCGDHMNPFYNPLKSSTSVIPICPGFKNCPIIQSYSEGSSWNGYKVQDTVQIGNSNLENTTLSSHKTIPFSFGCQVSETGMFRSQHVDGIMGLSSDHDTLPYQLFENGVTNSPSFAMCFNLNGGFISFGGMDKYLLSSDTEHKMGYLKLVRSSGFYTVRLLDVRMRSTSSGIRLDGAQSSTGVSLGHPTSYYNSGRGCIIDSGTTDTYLPKAVTSKFNSLFLSITGFKYTTDMIDLTEAQLKKMPTFIFQIESELRGSNGGLLINSLIVPYVDVVMTPESYVEKVDTRIVNGKQVNSYIFRIFLTENGGTVLGSNFMNNHYLLFDSHHERIGIIPSTCTYVNLTAAPIVDARKGGNLFNSNSIQSKETLNNIQISSDHSVPSNMNINHDSIFTSKNNVSNDMLMKSQVVSIGGTLRLYDGLDGFNAHSLHLLMIVFVSGWVLMIFLLVLLRQRKSRVTSSSNSTISV